MHQSMLSRVTATSMALSALLALATAPLAAMTVDEVIAKHIEARGGDAWKSVESIRLAGTFTSFSTVSDFTILRKAERSYRLETELNGTPLVVGFDGELGWQHTAFYGFDWPQKMTGLDRQVLMQDVDLATPFFDYRDRGLTVELLDNGDLDGQEAIRIRLVRSDGPEETWYLDPESYLDIGRDTTGSDFGNPAPQRTFFDDFREIHGVQIPFYVETQWYTRNRVFEVAEAKVNVDLDDSVFALPSPPGMGRLGSMAGDWHVKVEERPQPGMPWLESERQTTIASELHGAVLREHATSDRGTEIVTELSYDQFRERYVLTAINDLTYHLDVQHGAFDDDGRLTLSNAETDTSWTGFGTTFHQRHSIFDITEDGFKVEQETSVDGGENWFLNTKLTYSRAQ